MPPDLGCPKWRRATITVTQNRKLLRCPAEYAGGGGDHLQPPSIQWPDRPKRESPSNGSRDHVDDATCDYWVHHPLRAHPRQTETRENGTVQAIDALSLVFSHLALPRRRPRRLCFSLTTTGASCAVCRQIQRVSCSAAQDKQKPTPPNTRPRHDAPCRPMPCHSMSISKTEPISALVPPKTALRSVNPAAPGQVAKSRVVITQRARVLVSRR